MGGRRQHGAYLHQSHQCHIAGLKALPCLLLRLGQTSNSISYCLSPWFHYNLALFREPGPLGAQKLSNHNYSRRAEAIFTYQSAFWAICKNLSSTDWQWPFATALRSGYCHFPCHWSSLLGLFSVLEAPVENRNLTTVSASAGACHATSLSCLAGTVTFRCSAEAYRWNLALFCD